MVVNISVFEYRNYGKIYKVERKCVFFIFEFWSGDYIIFYWKFYWYYVIVEYIDRKNGKIGVIYYNKIFEGFM